MGIILNCGPFGDWEYLGKKEDHKEGSQFRTTPPNNPKP